MKVNISSDSTCDLSKALLEQYKIGITPLYVVKDGVSYADGLEITADEIFAHVRAGGALCSTAAVNVSDYIDFFTRQKESCDEIVHFTISSEMSSCYKNACIAAEEVGGVYVIDSRTLSSGIGHLVLDAAELALEGKSGSEIFEQMESKKSKLNVSFILNTLEYLRKGGRCSTIAALGANLLQLKPCIEVHEGKMGVAKKYRGKLSGALEQYVKDKLANPDTVDPHRIFITDSGVSDETFELVRKTILSCIPDAQIHHTRAGCTISSHCGPQCLGILFYNR